MIIEILNIITIKVILEANPVRHEDKGDISYVMRYFMPEYYYQYTCQSIVNICLLINILLFYNIGIQYALKVSAN